MLYTLNQYNVIYQMYLNKTGEKIQERKKKKKGFAVMLTYGQEWRGTSIPRGNQSRAQMDRPEYLVVPTLLHTYLWKAPFQAYRDEWGPPSLELAFQ